MLLACSVDTPIHINRSHLLASRQRVASRILCGLGLNAHGRMLLLFHYFLLMASLTDWSRFLHKTKMIAWIYTLVSNHQKGISIDVSNQWGTERGVRMYSQYCTFRRWSIHVKMSKSLAPPLASNIQPLGGRRTPPCIYFPKHQSCEQTNSWSWIFIHSIHVKRTNTRKQKLESFFKVSLCINFASVKHPDGGLLVFISGVEKKTTPPFVELVGKSKDLRRAHD